MKSPLAMSKNVRKSMQGNKGKDTSIEVLFRKALWHRNVRFRKNCCNVFGKPDVVIKKYHLAIFCDGDFWHGNRYDRIHAHKKYWDEKIKRNQERDFEVTIRLRDEGWTVFRFWESDIRNDVEACVNEVIKYIENKQSKQYKNRHFV